MATFLKTTQIPVAGAHALPGRYFTSTEIFALESERVFGRRWLCVGREAQLAEPGDYVVQQVGTESVIILRDDTRALRAFHNVCRHRGTRLCTAPAGQLSETIQCPYHAWTWRLDGRLIGAPSADSIEHFRKIDYPLLPVAVATWEGFLFINLADEPEPFEQAYAPLLGRFSRFAIAGLRPSRRIAYDVRANWKLLFENYSECYHCAPVHPALTKLSPPTSGENDLFDGPFLGGFMTIAEGNESLTMSGRSCGVAVGALPEEDRRRVWYYAIFPNLFLSLHPDYVMYHLIWPQEPGRTQITCEWLFHPDTLADPSFDPDDGVQFWDMTNRQDWEICERGQLGVSSRAYRPGPLSGRESMVAAFDRELLRALGHEAELSS